MWSSKGMPTRAIRDKGLTDKTFARRLAISAVRSGQRQAHLPPSHDQAAPEPKSMTKNQTGGGRVQRLVVLLFGSAWVNYGVD
jgi:hypothetical protein